MMNQSDLEFVVSDQREMFSYRSPGIFRQIDFDLYLNSEQIVIVSGIRRCGKSTDRKKRIPEFSEQASQINSLKFSE